MNPKGLRFMFCLLILSTFALPKDQVLPLEGDHAVTEKIHLICATWSGEPLDLSPNGDLILTDIDYNPVYQGVERVAPGKYRLNPPDLKPFHLLAVMEVPGYGKLKVFADNGGAGYTLAMCEAKPLSLNRELAKSRASVVLQEAYQGYWVETERRPEAAEALESLSEPLRKRVNEFESAYLSSGWTLDETAALLAAGMRLGEDVVVDRARSRIRNSPRRDGFLFGANCFAVRQKLPMYETYFAGLLNFGTVPFYLKGFEPEEGKVDARGADACLRFLDEYGLAAKGHPLVWFFRATTPEWLDGRTFEEMKQHVRDRVFRDVSAYRGRIDVWDIINEAHDWANCYEYSHDQLVELTRAAADAAREANPDCTRIVNSCCVFGEYVAGGWGHQSREARPRVTPQRYVDRLVRDGVGFEVVGLQLYYTGFDLLEHRRLLDRFARFGKPIHITEVAVPSATDFDEKSHWKDPDAVPKMGVWRRPWDEELQADWVEAFYTICYAHPAVEAVTWWDFSDQPPHFFPHGGFLDDSGEPKESYRRLRSLLNTWGFGGVEESGAG